MSPYGKRKLRAIIQKTGAEFAGSQPPGSIGETLGSDGGWTTRGGRKENTQGTFQCQLKNNRPKCSR